MYEVRPNGLGILLARPIRTQGAGTKFTQARSLPAPERAPSSAVDEPEKVGDLTLPATRAAAIPCYRAVPRKARGPIDCPSL